MEGFYATWGQVDAQISVAMVEYPVGRGMSAIPIPLASSKWLVLGWVFLSEFSCLWSRIGRIRSYFMPPGGLLCYPAKLCLLRRCLMG